MAGLPVTPSANAFPSVWKQTTLWQKLSSDASDLACDVRSTLNGCMPLIEAVLDKGGTAATDFTLHDSGHAFRVAERMTQIIPSEVLQSLTVYELAFLLLAAYLHDIGMTPDLGKVTGHHRYLLTGDAGSLTSDEIAEFQKWLDEDERGYTPPLVVGRLTNEIMCRSHELVTHYSRHRHNDWSEEWIRKTLSGYKLGKYEEWIHDLIKLCRSHHDGYDELKGSAFDPILVKPNGHVVHLRYLACVLRVSDILEFDPERTPDIVFRHRSVSPESRIFWWKDHAVTLFIEDNRLVIHARPSNAAMHHAIRNMIDAINSELQVCRTLADETHFETCPGLREKLPHQWHLTASVFHRITPLNARYEYINGSFRPNTKKLLELLSGTALYGNPLMAVRELLQNAFDAVRERIAYNRLQETVPADPTLATKFGDVYTVTLHIEIDEEGAWLVCTDKGVGMTRSIIENQVLVSGTSRKHDVLELERKCRDNGFVLGRTGQLGIGVLSYFMLADRVVIRTRRSQEPGDSDGTGWQFSTDGVGSFGELQRIPDQSIGSQVRLHLRENVISSDPLQWFDTLATFIRDTLVYIPCSLHLRSPSKNLKDITMHPGWCRDKETFTKLLISELQREPYQPREATPVELLSVARRQEIESEEKEIGTLRKEVMRALRWKVHEKEMPDGAGFIRIHFPYFHLKGGESLAFLRADEKNSNALQKVIRGYVFHPSCMVFQSWKGIAVGRGISRLDMHSKDGSGGAFVEINWHSALAGDIGVNRNHFAPNSKTTLYHSWIIQELESVKKKILLRAAKSSFSSLNYRLSGARLPDNEILHWLSVSVHKNMMRANWEPLKFPTIPSVVFISGDMPDKKVKWKRCNVSICPCLPSIHEGNHYDGITWFTQGVQPDRVMVLRTKFPWDNCVGGRSKFDVSRIQIVPFWTRPPKFGMPAHIAGLTSEFPGVWPTVCGVDFKNYTGYSKSAAVWNRQHWLLQGLDSEGWDWCIKTFTKSLDPLPVKNELLTCISKASAWVLHSLSRQSNEVWNGLKDRDRCFLPDLWQVLFSNVDRSEYVAQVVCQWVEETSGRRLRVLSPKGWGVLRPSDNSQRKEIEKLMGEVGPDWTLTMGA